MLQGEGGGWSRTDLPAAHEHLSRALSLATDGGNKLLQAEVLGSLSMYHLMMAEEAEAYVGIEQRAAATHAARQACQLCREARGGEEHASELTNLAVALLLCRVPGEEAAGAAVEEEAEGLLNRAVEHATLHQETQQGVRAYSALASLHESRGAIEEATGCLDAAVKLYRAQLPLQPHASRLAVVAAGHHDQARWKEKLSSLKDLHATLQL